MRIPRILSLMAKRTIVNLKPILSWCGLLSSGLTVIHGPKKSCMITLFNIAKARVLHHSAFISRFYRLTCMWTKQGQDFQYY